MSPLDGLVAYIGLGSNLGDPARQVRDALGEIAHLPESGLVARSPLYRSAPMGPQEQPHYVNAVAALRTRLTPRALMEALRSIEDAHGRDRAGVRWGPRTLDLDILLYGDVVAEDPELVIPHPGLTSRNFVVYPLLRVAPGLVLPDGRSLEEIAAGLTTEGLEEMTDDSRASERQSA
jgi:2-amino-4-hydroxy-6-hydroxymethyldihydropteridine diphosphokinase